jgi:hypothetical protein
MSQFPHDRFNKNLFELRLSPFGEVNKIQDCIIKALQIQKEVCPEPDPQTELHPRMWIITPTLAAHKLSRASS